MSQLSFIGLCVEQYADRTHRPSNEVYQMFRNRGLLAFLRSDYEDLHGMSVEYLMQLCHAYLEGASQP